MPPQIDRYHIADFGSIRAATEAAAAMLEHVGSPRGLRHMTGPRRAVVWGESQAALPQDQSRLFLSDGALEAAQELRLVYTQGPTITSAELPGTRKLILGQP